MVVSDFGLSSRDWRKGGSGRGWIRPTGRPSPPPSRGPPDVSTRLRPRRGHYFIDSRRNSGCSNRHVKSVWWALSAPCRSLCLCNMCRPFFHPQSSKCRS